MVKKRKKATASRVDVKAQPANDKGVVGRNSKQYKVYCHIKADSLQSIIGLTYSFGELYEYKGPYKKRSNKFSFDGGNFCYLGNVDDEEFMETYSEGAELVYLCAEGSWLDIKDAVGNICQHLAGQDCLNMTSDDNLKVELGNVFHEAIIYDNETPLFTMCGQICDRCNVYCYPEDFPCPSHAIVGPDDINDFMKKWEKGQSTKSKKLHNN